MIDSLALLAPGDERPAKQPSLVLVDDRAYEAGVFLRVVREVVPGPGIECETTDAGPVYRVRHVDVLGPNRVDAHVLFFAATDTDVKTLAPVARACRAATFVVHEHQDQTATGALDAEGFAHIPYLPGGHLPKAEAAMLGSDWSPQRREFIRRCRRAGVPTLTLQEAVNVDFDGPPWRMRWADAACISGPQALRYLRRELSFLTGNPRFDGYAASPPPAKPRILINCNFILGLGGERGPAWMKLVLEVVEGLGLDFAITKHPRDDTDLSGIPNVMPSGAYKVRDQLEACTVLISRDSSLPYEALLTGRPVIYFDPFHEKERTLREDDSGLIVKCDSVERLRAALVSVPALAKTAQAANAQDDPYTFLFTERGEGSAGRALHALHAIARWRDLYRTTDALEDRGARAILREWSELRLRPQLRRVAPLRKVWRAARRFTR